MRQYGRSDVNTPAAQPDRKTSTKLKVMHLSAMTMGCAKPGQRRIPHLLQKASLAARFAASKGHQSQVRAIQAKAKAFVFGLSGAFVQCRSSRRGGWRAAVAVSVFAAGPHGTGGLPAARRVGGAAGCVSLRQQGHASATDEVVRDRHQALGIRDPKIRPVLRLDRCRNVPA